ncbi:MAG: PTS sugar transporter subunit IIC [Treponema sp.]|nr:PTS sugar transporter subunit IIC [Treponema sp.]
MNKYVKRYLIDALGGMAHGLFASLLVGTIIKTLGQLLLRLGDNAAFQFLVDAGNFATDAHVVGAAMAIAIGYAMNAPVLVLLSLAAVGSASNVLGGAGGPLAVLVIAIVATELGCLVSKKTKVDILVTPLVTILSGTLLAVLCAKYIGLAASSVGNLIMWATNLHPFVMGIIVSVVVGIVLTLPISSAAICAALGLTGLAGGAAVAGCCANMIGFAVMSFRENKWGGLVSQGLGTSMLQMPNIVKNVRIWIPVILTSAITGPISTCLFKLQMNGAPVSSGMGTCGFVGQIGMITGWFSPSDAALAQGATAITPGAMEWIGLVLVSFVLPAVLSWAFGLLFRKIGWIKEGDLTLE